ncbi:MAG: EpsG family protein [Clostridia bacterium]|nr:EpsG family protein [Clostridia bacterium]
MLPYYLLVLAPPAISYLLCSRQQDKKRRIVMSMLLFFAGYLLLLCLRDISIGVDNRNYSHIFEQIADLKWDKLADVEMEQGFVFLNKLVSTFTEDYQLLISVISMIAVVPMAIFYVKESESSFLAIALFIGIAPFSMYFSGLRQILAIAFVFPVYYCAKHKKPLLFILLVLAAMLFHKSAFIMFIIYPIFHIKITPNKMLILAPAILFIYIFNESIFGFLLRIMGDKYEEQYGELQATGAIMMIVLFAILVFFAFVIPEEDKMEKETVGLRNMLVICLVLQLFSPVSTVAMRMNYYFLPFVPVLIPKIINRSKQQYRQVAMLATAVLVLFFVIRFFFTASTGADILQIFPYKFYFE